MARPPTPLGAHGKIFVVQDGDLWRAETYVRTRTGASKRIRRWRKTQSAAENAVKEAAANVSGGTRLVTPATRMKKVAVMWLDRIEREVRDGSMSPDSLRTYTSTANNWVTGPSCPIGKLQALEYTAAVCEDAILAAREETSYDTAKLVKTVLSGMGQILVSHGVCDVNPAKQVGRMTRGGKPKKVVALSREQRADLLAKLRALGPEKQTDAMGRSLGERGRIWLDLPDVMEAMLATGVRLGELLALMPEDVDPSVPEVRIEHHLLRVKAVGLERRDGRKANRDGIRLGVPMWSVPMWRRRILASGGGPLFPSAVGTWLDPSNTINRIREAMHDERVGYGWVTSHVFRKTVATVLDEAGLPTTAVADQLGNTPAVTEKSYRARRTANPEAVQALEGMM